jgi:hypothetical protein
MSDGALIQFACVSVFKFMALVIQIEVCQKYICMVFVKDPRYNEDHMKLDLPISLSM